MEVRFLLRTIFLKNKHKGETLLEFLIASVIFAVVLVISVEFVVSKVQILSFFKRNDDYTFNANSLLNYIDAEHKQQAAEFLLKNHIDDIEFKRENNFIKVFLKNGGVLEFEIAK